MSTEGGPVKRLTWAACLGILLALSGPAAGHILREAPWHPIAGAYRSTLFLLGLTPVDWSLIERKWTTDDDGRVFGATADERVRQLDAATGSTRWPAIQQALADRDADALYDASTRALAQAIRHQLAEATAALERPGAAATALAEAEQLYRAFADFIRQTDPEGYRELGLAWLDLMSSAGHAGLAEVGGRPADRAAFMAARTTIEDYLTANYEPEVFAPRTSFAAVPEQSLRADPTLSPAPWLPPGSDLNDQTPLPRLVLKFEEQGIDERDLFLIAYGDMLFDSPEIFGEPARSLGLTCSTCHNRSDINQRFFIPGITPKPGVVDVDGSFFNPRFNDHRADAVDIPSLRGIRFTGPYGRDGRFGSLRDFTRNVIVNEFAGAEPTPLMLDALLAYMLEFDFLPAPLLDFDGRIDDRAPEAAKRGEALFMRPFEQMNGRSCASCHIPDSHFTDNRPHDIGSDGGSDGGSYASAGGYDTPTLLNIVHTAPYFHDGSLDTLPDVVAWFDQRYRLDLDEGERADLVAYLEAVGTGEEPYERFDAENTPFRLAAGELSVFLSTLDTLIPARDQVHAELLLRTVATDLAFDASAMSNRYGVAKVHELAESLEPIRLAIVDGRWDEAERLWAAYQALEQQYDPELF
jgi:hypothetical protein